MKHLAQCLACTRKMITKYEFSFLSFLVQCNHQFINELVTQRLGKVGESNGCRRMWKKRNRNRNESLTREKDSVTGI